MIKTQNTSQEKGEPGQNNTSERGTNFVNDTNLENIQGVMPLTPGTKKVSQNSDKQNASQKYRLTANAHANPSLSMSSLDEAELLRTLSNNTRPSVPQGNVSSELSQASQVTTMTSIDEEDILRRYPVNRVISRQDDVAMQDIPTDIYEPAFGTQI